MTAAFDVIVANFGPSSAHNGHRAAVWVKEQKREDHPLLIAGCEFDGVPRTPDEVHQAMKAVMPDSHWYHGQATHGAREVVLGVLGDRFPVTRHSTYLLTPGAGRTGADQDRWCTEVEGHPGDHEVTLFSLHTSTTHPLEALRRVAPKVKAAVKRGSVMVLGDLNTDNAAQVHAWARSVGLTRATNTRVMWGLWTPDLTVHTQLLDTPPAKGISDHPKQIRLQVTLP